jgi:GAF domain-containing protein
VFETILRNLLRLFGTRFALVALVDGDMIKCVGLKGDSGFEKLAEHYPVPLNDKTNVGKAIISGHTLRLVPIVGNPEAPPGTERFAREFGYNSIISVPLFRQGVAIGAINTAHRDAIPFTDKQVALIKSFANQAVIAIENTRLLNELRQRTSDLTESLEQQTATSKVLEVISRSAFDLQAVFETVAESSVRLCGADRAFIWRFNGELLRVAAIFNAPQNLRD